MVTVKKFHGKSQIFVFILAQKQNQEFFVPGFDRRASRNSQNRQG
jgi:hypothetical protein